MTLKLAGNLLLIFLFSCSTAPITYRNLKECRVKPSQAVEVKKLADKGFPQAQLCEGKLLLKGGRNKEARRYLLMAFKSLKGKKKGEAAYLIGKSFLKEGKRKEAREWFFKATENLYPNRELFKLTDYLTLKELKRLEELGKREPVLYLYIGDYLKENELFRGALFYYQLAIRYGIREARLGSAACLFKLGNQKLARSILLTEYERGNRKAAQVMGELLFEAASSVGKGECLLIEVKSPEEFLRERVAQIKEKAELYREASRWFKKAGEERRAEESLHLYRVYSFKEREKLPKKELPNKQLMELCREGELWAEYLLSQRLKTPNSEAAQLLYRKLFKQ
ncbi:hypothetical protein [Thermovibrio sp.]